MGLAAPGGGRRRPGGKRPFASGRAERPIRIEAGQVQEVAVVEFTTPPVVVPRRAVLDVVATVGDFGAWGAARVTSMP